MAQTRSFKKYVDEIKAYGINWATVLANANNGTEDTISTSAWAISPSGLTNVTDSIDAGSTRTKIKVSGGTDTVEYILENTITLATSGYTLQDYIKIRVHEID